MTKILGLTGGIASGKSTVDVFFREKQIPVIDCDQIAHDILNKGEKGYELVLKQFGMNILKSDQSINRSALGQIVFDDEKQLETLNRITHPLIFQEIQAKIALNNPSKNSLVVVDAPVLFEANGQKYCDFTLLIAIPESLQMKRLMLRDRLSKGAALKRIRSQMPLSQKEKLADFVINNTGTKQDLKSKLEQLLLEIKGEDLYGMS
ncbi:Dephospho-CoA kinase [Lactobacillus kimbladii]|uniref:Dephospho-CoA kinase n=1 Tax=Lactobacillus kimbladii TaxID=1218506 RepID=A0A0F4LIH5_9LACO|nr:dephospho-CoA kinase [Lactobacillus kimbladii]KJY58039.1 Dephospho-CoA kinase [Lactobacillus kimbladii]